MDKLASIFIIALAVLVIAVGLAIYAGIISPPVDALADGLQAIVK